MPYVPGPVFWPRPTKLMAEFVAVPSPKNSRFTPSGSEAIAVDSLLSSTLRNPVLLSEVMPICERFALPVVNPGILPVTTLFSRLCTARTLASASNAPAFLILGSNVN